MTWEMAMKSIAIDGPYVAAILGATLAVITILIYQIRDLLMKRDFYDHALKENTSALIAADRVLKNGATPEIIRRQLLCMLTTLADSEASRGFVEYFTSLEPKKRKPAPANDDELSEAMNKLHANHSKLAADAHKALMGILMAILVTSADKIEIHEYEAEGAVNPGSILSRAAKALAGLPKGNGHDGINGGVAHA